MTARREALDPLCNLKEASDAASVPSLSAFFCHGNKVSAALLQKSHMGCRCPGVSSGILGPTGRLGGGETKQSKAIKKRGWGWGAGGGVAQFETRCSADSRSGMLAVLLNLENDGLDTKLPDLISEGKCLGTPVQPPKAI